MIRMPDEYLFFRGALLPFPTSGPLDDALCPPDVSGKTGARLNKTRPP